MNRQRYWFDSAFIVAGITMGRFCDFLTDKAAFACAGVLVFVFSMVMAIVKGEKL